MSGIKIKNFTKIILITITWPFVIYSHNAFAFQTQYRSAHYLGRGDAGLASAEGGDAMFYNPAGIAQGDSNFKELFLVSPQIEGSDNLYDIYSKKNESDTAVINYIEQNPNRTTYGAAQNLSALVFKHFALGVMQRGEIAGDVQTNSTTNVTSLEIKSNMWKGGYVTVAQGLLNDHLLVGFTAKAVEKTQYDLKLDTTNVTSSLQTKSLQALFLDTERKGNSIGADFGAMLVLDKGTQTNIGIVLKNLGMDYQWNTEVGEKTPDSDSQEFNLGCSTSFGTKKSHVKLFADYRDVLNQNKEIDSKHIHAGLEYNLKNVLMLMVGMNDGALAYGGSLNFKVIRFEAGSYTESHLNLPNQDADIRYFGRISLGWVL